MRDETIRDQMRAVAEALRDEFDAEGGVEEVAPDRFRIELTAGRFNGVSMIRRQSAIWDFIEREFGREIVLHLVGVLTTAPEDFDTDKQIRELEAALGGGD